MRSRPLYILALAAGGTAGALLPRAFNYLAIRMPVLTFSAWGLLVVGWMTYAIVSSMKKCFRRT